MSNLEVAETTSPIYTYDFPVLAVGTVSSSCVNATAIPNYSHACSRILGVSLVSGTGAGTVSATRKEIAATAGALFPQVVLSSSNNTDTGVYRMYFQNDVQLSPYLTIKPC
jgi:hypothetical protein